MPLAKRILICLWLVLLAPAVVFASEKILTIGFFPYTTQTKLLSHQKMLTDYLQQRMQGKLTVQVAENMPGFVSNMNMNQYDIIFTPPHVARYSETSLGYQRIAMTTHIIKSVYVVHRDSAIKDLTELRGKTIVMASPLALLTQDTKAKLREQGLVDQETVYIKTASSHKNAIFMVLHREADVAVTGVKLWHRYAESHKKHLKVLAEGEPLPGMMIMANKDLPVDTVNQLQRYLLEFENSPQGKKYIFHSFKRIDNPTMHALDPYTKVFK